MSATLITGADGHVGSALARWLLTHTDRDLLLFVRANDAAARKDKTARLGDLAKNQRCTVVYGDLTANQPFSGLSTDAVGEIIHSAAVTDFGVDKDIAQAVNVDGTAKLLDFASLCGGLRRFAFVSSLYAAGLRDGVIEEAPLDDSAEFANHYEWSKWKAESLICAREDLPWQIFRVATIVGEDASGKVVQQNVIHNTLRLLYYGLLSVIPGTPETRVYLVSTEFVTNAMGPLLIGDGKHAVHHVSETGDDAITLGALLDIVYDTFLADPGFARQRILKPLFCDKKAFDSLAETLQQFDGVTSQALQSVAPFAPQLFSDKDYRTARSTQANSKTLLESVAQHLVSTRWGLEAPARSPL